MAARDPFEIGAAIAEYLNAALGSKPVSEKLRRVFSEIEQVPPFCYPVRIVGEELVVAAERAGSYSALKRRAALVEKELRDRMPEVGNLRIRPVYLPKED